MLKLISALAIFFFGITSHSAGASQAAPVKHRSHSHAKKMSAPVRNQEWYLKQIRESDRFKAIALGKDFEKSSVVEPIVIQKSLPNHPAFESDSDVKRDSSKVTFMFVPAFLNHKLMDLQSRPNSYPTFMLTWKE